VQTSRIPEFYKLSVADRVRLVREKGMLSKDDYLALASGEHTLKVHHADRMIENVIGVMGLPVGLGLNFLINGREYVVPLVVEEPSIVAALSSAAKLVRNCGRLRDSQHGSDPHRPDSDGGRAASEQGTGASPAASRRGDQPSEQPAPEPRGPRRRRARPRGHDPSLDVRAPGDMVVVHLLVDTCDAMGANLVNTMCEGVASLVETIAGGKVLLRILSNLTDRALVWARCTIPVSELAGKGFTGEQVREGILIAAELAAVIRIAPPLTTRA
jgi:hydroxymethylglutaryl-CoA reductase